MVINDPAPRHDDDDLLKEYPCGEDGQYNAFDMGPSTVLQPGWQPLVFRETVNHDGSPFRLALSVQNDDGYDTHVLMDQIPHLDDGTTASTSPDDDKYHRVWVDIPDINCTQCGIQVIQIMVDKFYMTGIDVCPPEELENNCGNDGYVYYSCSNVQIGGQVPARELSEFYVSVDGATEPAGWSYLNGTWVESEDGVYEMPGQSDQSGPTLETESSIAVSAISSSSFDVVAFWLIAVPAIALALGGVLFLRRYKQNGSQLEEDADTAFQQYRSI